MVYPRLHLIGGVLPVPDHGFSQAMRTSFFEDVISLVPAIAFLIGTAIARRNARPDFPYGRHRATSIAHLTAALALCMMGGFLLFEAVMSYTTGEKATIGGFNLFGHMIWGGWPMLAALVYTEPGLDRRRDGPDA